MSDSLCVKIKEEVLGNVFPKHKTDDNPYLTEDCRVKMKHQPADGIAGNGGDFPMEVDIAGTELEHACYKCKLITTEDIHSTAIQETLADDSIDAAENSWKISVQQGMLVAAWGTLGHKLIKAEDVCLSKVEDESAVPQEISRVEHGSTPEEFHGRIKVEDVCLKKVKAEAVGATETPAKVSSLKSLVGGVICYNQSLTKKLLIDNHIKKEPVVDNVKITLREEGISRAGLGGTSGEASCGHLLIENENVCCPKVKEAADEATKIPAATTLLNSLIQLKEELPRAKLGDTSRTPVHSSYVCRQIKTEEIHLEVDGQAFECISNAAVMTNSLKSSIQQTSNASHPITDSNPYKYCSKKKLPNSEVTKSDYSSTALKPFVCNVCGYKCSRNSYLILHKRRHSGEKPIACGLCDYKCSRNRSLKVHMMTHTGEKPYACDICDYKCREGGNLKIHKKKHTSEKPHACSICNYKCRYEGDFRKHMRMHEGHKPYTCLMCDYKYSEPGDFKRHVRIHTGEKPYACDMCSYKCTNAGDYKRHKRSHTGEKPYTCDVCDYKCGEVGNLNRHKKIHTGEKPFACDVCGHKFRTSGDFKIHMRTHSGEKPYLCNICNFKCTLSGNLKAHMRTHTGEKAYTCEICGWECSNPGSMKKHKGNHSKQDTVENR